MLIQLLIAVLALRISCVQSNVADLQRFTKNHAKLQCFDLGFALDTFRMVGTCCGLGCAGRMRLGACRPVQSVLPILLAQPMPHLLQPWEVARRMWPPCPRAGMHPPLQILPLPPSQPAQVALTSNFRKLQSDVVVKACQR